MNFGCDDGKMLARHIFHGFQHFVGAPIENVSRHHIAGRFHAVAARAGKPDDAAHCFQLGA
jgi:hypothetical protein